MDLRRGGKAAIDRMIEAYGVDTKQALCEKLGISSSTLANRYLRDTFPADYIIQCALETGVSLEWLTFGKGQKLKCLPPNKSAISSASVNEGLISTPVKTLVNEQLISSPKITLDRSIIPEAVKAPVIVIDENVKYLADEQPRVLTNGIWLLKIEDAYLIKNIVKIPTDKIKIISLDNNHSFECSINDIQFTARCFCHFMTPI
ncbi:phage repressor protein CI [Enterobacter cancerogenus]|uniref:phage repressor protein CI n=1 Tax=Enterobacter cancerogenus TaxID=69218 RepID=UPI0037FA6D87